MGNILIFAGTSEGRKLIEYFSNLKIHLTACVATEYGEQLIEKSEFVHVLSERFNREQMFALMQQNDFDLVIDATHPYAKEVSENIHWACCQSKREYIRIIRQKAFYKNCIYVESYDQAVSYLNKTEGNILLTTGSKDLESFTRIIDFENRIYPRILPMSKGIEKCFTLGFQPRNVICMQGPFSQDLNTAMLRQIDAKFLVTKDSGKAGCLGEKISAAENVGAKVIIIGRPIEENGFELDQAISFFNTRFEINTIENLPAKFPLFIDLEHKKIVVIGAGKIAQRRIEKLLPFQCNIIVVADKPSEKIEQYHHEIQLTFILRKFNKADLDGAFMVIAATNSREINHDIYLECIERNLFCSIADCKEECSFYFPALIHYQKGIIGVCGNGEDHSATSDMAAYIRHSIKEKETRKHEKN